MDHIQFPYRSSSHLALMHVINESGAWERNGLRVDFDKIISRGDAHELVPKGEVEFVSGNHVSTYATRAWGDGDVDGCFVNEPRREQARRRGLKLIDIPTQPMVFFMTLSSSMKMVQERPDVVKRVIKSVLEGIAYFKINREETIKVLMAKHN